jgi:hypothetical protein
VDADLFKHAPPLPVIMPDGSLLQLRPLPADTVDRCTLAARLELKARGCTGQVVPFALLVGQLLLKEATGRDLGGELHACELFALVKQWGDWQEKCDPVKSGQFALLIGTVRRRVNDDPDVHRDAMRAYEAKTAAAYYGRPLVDLTDGQVAYWQTLNNAYYEFFGGGGKTPTKKWLRSDPSEG